MAKARVIAFYLPQYHPVPLNDQWWGKGFTEWTNVAKAKPLFKGHYQPHIPADLGFYDLRMAEVREQQAGLAREAGVEGFCYWHYWFGNGRMLLERPFYEVLTSGNPDFPFCLGWANHDWGTGTWQNSSGTFEKKIIMKQDYPGDADYIQHFNYVLPAFKDPRYLTVDGKPIFYIYNPLHFDDIKHFIELWQQLALDNGLKGIYFIGSCQSFNEKDYTRKELVTRRFNLKTESAFNEIFDLGFDGINSRGENLAFYNSLSVATMIKRKLFKKFFGKGALAVCEQKDINKHLYCKADWSENVYPTLIPNFDRSPRAGKRAIIWNNSTPEIFREQVTTALKIVSQRPFEHRILFLQSWNEWGEGNHVEPDLKYGKGYIKVLGDLIKD